jgi:AAA+ superfamily predicted ATPase
MSATVLDRLRAADTGPFAWLRRAYGLTDPELDVVTAALTPEIEPRDRPTVGQVLDKLYPDPAGRLAGRALFAATSPLLRNRIVVLDTTDVPLIARTVRLDEQIVDVLLGASTLDSRLASWCRLSAPAIGVAGLGWGRTPAARIAELLATGHRRLHLEGPPGSGRLRAAEAVAADLGVPLLVAALGSAPADGFADAVYCLLREAGLYNAVTYLDEPDLLDDTRLRAVHTVLSSSDQIVLLAGPPTPGVVNVPFGPLDPTERLACWREALPGAPGSALEVVADRFQLTPGHIADAARIASGHSVAELSAAARSQSGRDLAGLAERVAPKATWADLVAPPDTIAALHEICARVAGRERVLHRWGFDEKLSRGTGVTALLTGPPGTGKTMAAEVVAGELGLDLYRIDLAGVVSKYIGETEKNIERIFSTARQSNAILLFDEADALLGKRSEVRDAHDRYANIEVAYLLQRMESYDGLALLSTNLRNNLDEAFARRLAFTVHFPFPSEADRARIWRGIWPSRVPLADDVDLDALATRFKLSGGNIKNIALAAAFLAGDEVTMADLLHAVAREYQKLGKNVGPLDG